ncbi:GTPase-binding rid1-like protein [Cladobotryum mycophilum]|uniref:GTPase-binding rid1-like protein n=1 Tax=Cladobotryum mycophilum TaxID=491253 RepID=A0ABR0S6V2_9HYPO
MAIGGFAKNNPGALGELQQNQQESAPRSPRRSRDERRFEVADRSRSPTKTSFLSLAKSRETSPTKKTKEPKSGSNFTDFLGRPKSLKNLHKILTDDDIRSSKDKENRTPDETLSSPIPPIYAQFAQGTSMSPRGIGSPTGSIGRDSSDSNSKACPPTKERPKSFMFPSRSSHNVKSESKKSDLVGRGLKTSDGKSSQTQRSKAFSAFASFGHGRSKSTATSPKNGSVASASSAEYMLDPKDIDKQLEALLDRRNIPENQRYKMRNLNDTIKMEFIRQDWAEMQAAKLDRPATKGSLDSIEGAAAASAAVSDAEAEEKPKRSRGRSFTFSRGKKDNRSSSKKRGEGTLGRHFRSKSTDSVVSERPTSSASNNVGSSLLAKIKPGQRPDDYVGYLRKVQKPELIEVGKLHKLRLLLRNETVAWIEDFIQQGGMKEIVGLLNRIMEVEWREEHEDALLHENLLCLKALSTTAKAMEYLHSVQADLFPKLLHMLFDPEKKGPSEFTTRNIVTSVLFTYIESATPAERVSRARIVLGHLRDPVPDEAARPLPFVLEMRQDRPYRVWCREVVNVTKEVFWIFLHNLNIIALQSDKKDTEATETGMSRQGGGNDEQQQQQQQQQHSYMRRHFPPEKPPVPAAPYVGGVEWDATNYLASHLDLLNAILACTPSREDRNKLRADFRISGWERCLGGSLRLCKEKFYGSVHTGLRTWVVAAADDEWDVRDVRYGPPADSRSPAKKVGGGQRKKVEEAPKLDMPKLDFGLEQVQAPKDAWLS